MYIYTRNIIILAEPTRIHQTKNVYCMFRYHIMVSFRLNLADILTEPRRRENVVEFCRTLGDFQQTVKSQSLTVLS